MDLESVMKRRTTRVLIYCYAMLIVSALLMFVGVTAAFWHMAWWIGVAFLVMAVLSLSITALAFGASGSRPRSTAK